MYVASLQIQSFRCFADAQTELYLDSGDGEGSLTAILGDNGAGKSSVLRAIALATLSRVIDQSGYVPSHLVRRGSEGPAKLEVGLRLDPPELTPGEDGTERSGELTVLVKGSTERLYRPPSFEKDDGYTGWEGLYEEDSPSFFVAGYGATRRVDLSETFDPAQLRKLRITRYQRVAGLFEDHVALVPLHAWLPRASDALQHEVTELINRALPEEMRFSGKFERGEAMFEFHGAPLPFAALSDGYRGFIGLVGDLLYHLAAVASGKRLDALSGVVLVDELDLHLHPTWQRTVAQKLTRAFPRLQFVVTTHSPLVVGTLAREQIRVLDIEAVDGGYPRVTIRTPTEDVHGLNVDDVLLSSYFGLSSTRAPETRREEQALISRAASGDSEAALELLRKMAGDGKR